jgi:uncharacterized membrane protein YgcG
MFLVAVAIPAVATAQQSATAPAAPAPQQTPAGEEPVSDEPEIIVRGTRGLPGAVIGDIPPEEQLGPADIRSYGVNSVAELLNELAPQTRSGRGQGGQPVVLLNGRRISGFAEIRDLPTEAIARVDILPEEVALKYGYRADQRVVNFVLRQRFRALTAEAGARVTTQGDRFQPEVELDLLNIRRDQRFNLHSSYRQSDLLLESQRGILSNPSAFSLQGNVIGVNGGAIPGLGTSTIAGVPSGAATLAAFATTGATSTDAGPFRSLLGQSRSFSTNASYARNIFGSIGATINGRIEATTGRSLQGLPTVSLALPAGNPFSPFSGPVLVQRAVGDEPLTQRSASITSRLGATFNGDVGRWRWSLIGGYDRVDSRTTTDAGVDASGFQARLNAGDPTANPFGALALQRLADNRATSTSQVANLDAQASGTLFRLPAGEIVTSVAVGADMIDFASRSTRAGVTQRGEVSRDSASGRINLDLPVTSRNQDFGGAIGNLSLNLNGAVEQLSDFGTLTTLGYGANWAPIEAVRFIGSVTHQDGAPTPQQLGNPQIVTPNVRLFDFVNGTTANVTTISGGNPTLRGFSTHTTKLGVTIRPSKSRDLTLIANYVSARVNDPVAGFPAATAEIAGAFPGRFTRDAGGQLLRVDTRPVNFARTERSELRYGFNFSVPIKSEIQKQVEAFRAGTGPNPFAGLRPPGGRGGAEQGAGTPGIPGQPGAAPAGTPPAAGVAPAEGRRGGQGGAGGGGRGFGGGFGGGGGGRGFGGGGGPGGGGRLQFALYHTWHFTDEVLIAPGGPRLDLLDGDAIGSSGGQPRHELEGQAGYSNNGLGARLSVNFRSATEVQGGTAARPTGLRFGSLTTANLRLFADLGQRLDLVRKHPWLRGTRVALGVENIFDSRQRVLDATGATPINYQPDLLDPLGRTVRLSIRKLFF